MNTDRKKQLLNITFHSPEDTTPAVWQPADEGSATLLLFLNPLMYGNAPVEGHYGDGPDYSYADGTEIPECDVLAFGWLTTRPRWCMTEHQLNHAIESNNLEKPPLDGD